ncbi:MAG: D-alanyl-D-alanine carboxypeptidase family protein [Bacteroidales bacterium]|nr:D-alanyl-D-alanine carboxypeptidase family protein [Bacteroidales bacterium]
MNTMFSWVLIGFILARAEPAPPSPPQPPKPQVLKEQFLSFLGQQYGIPAMAHADTTGQVRIPQGLFLLSERQYDEFWQRTPFVELDLDGSGRKHRLQPLVAKQLQQAIADLRSAGIPFKIRGSDGVFRSYADARSIWLARMERELTHHRAQRPLSDTAAHRLLNAIADWGHRGQYIDQAALIFWQERNSPSPMMFGKLHKGPLYASCAAPGTSHHTLGIAIDLDIVTLRHAKALDIMAKHGFFRCIVSDFAHFAYLGPSFGQPEVLAQHNLKWVRHADGSDYLTVNEN